MSLTNPSPYHRTYLAFIRLSKAISAYRTTNPSSPATFTLKLAPYQLYPDATQEGVNKYEWYKNEKYDGSEDRMEKYMNAMRDLGKQEGIEFDFGGGVVANTLHAHRVLQWSQKNKEGGVALEGVKELYTLYFEQRAHPSSSETLVKACTAAGLGGEEAKKVVEDDEEELAETKAAIQEQAGNGVDSVPYVIFEGRKRDFTLVGAKSVAEYEKVLAQVAKECT
ncbi:uncharacterized protein J4E78_000042 [Alternaria triticimaculans]|uniref:uncharacterized protein n=1 Tax=Alternaria triticimaculans TaxID=297637 RepID=UPI0020C2DAE3|nr:uncharacterized protein J4E78_000042 [Alternaria triticimaculans]KAI4671546.1 hypothetical protein J4E78_000042 [Alternaria triticimaculans]